MLLLGHAELVFVADQPTPAMPFCWGQTATRAAQRQAYSLLAVRQHSHSAAPIRFAPGARPTSAWTEVPYGSPHEASSAYLPHDPSSGPKARAGSDEVTHTGPRELSDEAQALLDEIVRVDQAGELAANYIYKGQLAVLSRASASDARVNRLVQDMWDGEKKHIAVMDQLVSQFGVRPTLLYPVCRAAGYALGAGSALLGKEAAMACTEAVETAIGEHYDEQLRQLDSQQARDLLHALEEANALSHPAVALLRRIITEFRDDELGHLDTAVENDARAAPAHALFSSVVQAGCKAAIELCKRI